MESATVSGGFEGAEGALPESPTKSTQWRARGYLIAVAAIVLATVVRLSLQSLLGSNYPYFTYLAAVLFVATYADLGPSLLAAGVGALLSVYLFLPATYGFALTNPVDRIGVVLYLLNAVFAVGLGQSQRRARRSVESGRDLAIRQQVRLEAEADQRVHAEAALRSSEARLRRLVESNIIGILFGGSDGRLISCNDAFLHMLGYTRKEVESGGLTWQAITPPEYWSASKTILTQAAETGSSGPHEKEYVRKDGGRLPVMVGKARVASDSDEIVAFILDISEQKKAEAQLQRMNEELEQRVLARTDELELANKELESFCYSVSHDLRAPLRAVMGSSMILLEDYSDKLDSDGKHTLNRMVTAAKQMSQLIEDILQMSRLQRAEMQAQDVDLGEMAQGIVLELKSRAGSRTDFVVDPRLEGQIVSADPNLLRVALLNLVENAQKFSSKSAEPKVEIGLQPNGQERVLFVRDNGTGFDPQYSDKLWQPFERLHRSEEYPGSGIGLASVKRIIERHGGRIWAESEEGKGATFFFLI